MTLQLRPCLPLLLSLLMIGCATGDGAPADDQARLPEPDRDLRVRAGLMEALQGHWVDSAADGRTVFHEQWQPGGEGLGFVMVGNDTVWIEHLNISVPESDGPLVYSVSIASQNGGDTIPFKWTPSDDSTLLFTNPEHDFPQRIRYRRTGNGWAVALDGMEEGVPRKETFHFSPLLGPSQP